MKPLRKAALVVGVLLVGVLATAQAVAPGGLAGIVTGDHTFSGNVTVNGNLTTTANTVVGQNLYANGALDVFTGSSNPPLELGTWTVPSGDTVHFSQNISSGTPTVKSKIDVNGVLSGPGIVCTGSTHCGTQALTAGSATVTVVSGCHAICTDTTAAAAVKCSVASTTLTITGTSTDSINWFCF